MSKYNLETLGAAVKEKEATLQDEKTTKELIEKAKILGIDADEYLVKKKIVVSPTDEKIVDTSKEDVITPTASASTPPKKEESSDVAVAALKTISKHLESILEKNKKPEKAVTIGLYGHGPEGGK